MASQGAQDVPDARQTKILEAESSDVKLPTLSAADFRTFNHMAEGMDLYHNHFRQTWNQIYAACSASSSTNQALSASRLIKLSSQFVSQLTLHHNIEEAHIFPVLGAKMDAFRADALTGPLEQHRQIHAGIDKLQEYFDQCKSGERSLRRQEVKDILDSFGTVLWTHLAEEVEQLGAENMRKYWTKAEMLQMPM